MIIVQHRDIPRLLSIIDEAFVKFNLVLNPKKSLIVNIRGHERRWSPDKTLGIQYGTEYRFLGVTINNTGSISKHYASLFKKTNIIKANIKYLA